MKLSIRAGIAGLLISVAAAPAAAAADVSVRAEGGAQTIVSQITVPSAGADVVKQGKTCAGNSAGGALDRAVAGDWDGTAFAFGLSVDRIRTENLPFDSGKYWQFDVNNSGASVGICDYVPQPGDEILFYAACATATDGCFAGKPLGIQAPAGATPGKPFTVTVIEYDDTKSPATSAPAAGATLTGGGVTATTGADGKAKITVAKKGAVTLVATKGNQVRDAATVAVGTGAYAVDKTAPATRIKGIKDGATLRKGPRKLRATIAEAGALQRVTLSLERRADRQCTGFDGDSERFVNRACGRPPRFVVGTAKKLSYLLPRRLGSGRYVLTVLATDAAGNREQVRKGTNKVAFRVR
jgi:hypothetical protein